MPLPDPYLKLYHPAMKGVCLEWYFPGDKDGGNFATYMHINCPKSTGWFHQGGYGGDNDWHLFEWKYELDPQLVIDFCRQVAKHFGKTLIIDLPGVET